MAVLTAAIDRLHARGPSHLAVQMQNVYRQLHRDAMADSRLGGGERALSESGRLMPWTSVVEAACVQLWIWTQIQSDQLTVSLAQRAQDVLLLLLYVLVPPRWGTAMYRLRVVQTRLEMARVDDCIFYDGHDRCWMMKHTLRKENGALLKSGRCKVPALDNVDDLIDLCVGARCRQLALRGHPDAGDHVFVQRNGKPYPRRRGSSAWTKRVQRVVREGLAAAAAMREEDIDVTMIRMSSLALRRAYATSSLFDGDADDTTIDDTAHYMHTTVESLKQVYNKGDGGGAQNPTAMACDTFASDTDMVWRNLRASSRE